MNSECVFCRIIAGEIPSKKIFENENLIVIQDIAPMAPVHYLFIPKTHYPTLMQVKKFEILAEVYEQMVKIAAKLGLSDKGFRSVINTGTEGGQSVFHLHVHLLAGAQLKPQMG